MRGGVGSMTCTVAESALQFSSLSRAEMFRPSHYNKMGELVSKELGKLMDGVLIPY